MIHTCHADGCQAATPPWLLMCRDHWRMVPRPLQDRVTALYVRGQEVRKDPSREYLQAAARAVVAVAWMEGRSPVIQLLTAEPGLRRVYESLQPTAALPPALEPRLEQVS